MGVIVALELALLVVVIWVAVACIRHDIECDWVDDAGTRRQIVAVPDGWHVIAPDVTEPIRLNAGVWLWREQRGTYDHRGQIQWSDGGTWRRVSDTARGDLNWIKWRNLVQDWQIAGTWFGRPERTNVLVADRIWLQIADGVTATLKNGTHHDQLRGRLVPGGAEFTNDAGERFDFSWDGRCRGTFTIAGVRVTMDRLD